jgi:hypothetical protein
MKQILLYITVLIFLIDANVQASNHIFYCEKFIGSSQYDIGILPLYGWSSVDWGYNNPSGSNVWYIFGYIDCDGQFYFNPNCSSSCPGHPYNVTLSNSEDACLYVGKNHGSVNVNDTAKLGAVYNKGCDNKTHKLAQSPDINCSYGKELRIEFDYMGVGDLCHADFCRFRYSEDAGATWQSLGTCLVSPGGLPIWTHISMLIPDNPANFTNRNIRLGFEWQNDSDCIGHPYSFAVDNIILSGVSFCPEVSFTATPPAICAPASVTFNNTSISHNNSQCTTTTYLWKFGDGQTSNQFQPNHTYVSTPTSPATLIMTNCYGCTDSAKVNIPVNTVPPTMNSGSCITIIPTTNPNIYTVDLSSCAITDAEDIWITIQQTQLHVLYTPGLMVYFPLSGSYTIEVKVFNYCGAVTEQMIFPITI